MRIAIGSLVALTLFGIYVNIDKFNVIGNIIVNVGGTHIHPDNSGNNSSNYNNRNVSDESKPKGKSVLTTVSADDISNTLRTKKLPDTPIMHSTNNVGKTLPPRTVPIGKTIAISEENKPVAPILQSYRQETISRDLRNRTDIYKGYLRDRNDENTYEFTLHYSSAVNIVFNPSEKNTASYKLTVKNASDTTLTEKMIDGEKLSSTTGNLYLSAGTYRIEIKKGYSWSGKPYTVTVNISQPQTTEIESNNNFQTATVIPLNENIRASTGSKDDIDYFSFTLDKDSYVKPILKFKPVRTRKGKYDLKLYQLEIFDIDKKPFIFRGDNETWEIKPFILEAGTYIIGISRFKDLEDENNLGLGLHEYTLRVQVKEVNP